MALTVAEKSKVLRDRLRALGLCTVCRHGRLDDPKRWRCFDCRLRQAAYMLQYRRDGRAKSTAVRQRALRARRRKAGRCYVCGGGREDSTQGRCWECRLEAAEERQRYRLRTEGAKATHMTEDQKAGAVFEAMKADSICAYCFAEYNREDKWRNSTGAERVAVIAGWYCSAACRNAIIAIDSAKYEEDWLGRLAKRGFKCIRLPEEAYMELHAPYRSAGPL